MVKDEQIMNAIVLWTVLKCYVDIYRNQIHCKAPELLDKFNVITEAMDEVIDPFLMPRPNKPPKARNKRALI